MIVEHISLKAQCPKCPLIGVKVSLTFLKLIFCRKCMKFGCMIIYFENKSFSFFCQCCRTRISADKFSHVPLFHHLYPKIDSNVHFDPVFFFLILDSLTEKRKVLSDFPL